MTGLARNLFVYALLLCSAAQVECTNSNSNGCVTLSSTSLCSSLLTYSLTPSKSNSSSTVCLSSSSSSSSSSLLSFPQTESAFPTLWAILSSTCRTAVAQYECALAYPACGRTSICSDVCQNIKQTCTATTTTAAAAANTTLSTDIFSALSNLFPLQNCSSSSSSSSSSSCYSPSTSDADLQSSTSSPSSSSPSSSSSSGTRSVTVPVSQCVPYPSTGVCAGIIDYLVFQTPIESSIASSVTFNELLASSFAFLFTLVPKLLSTCQLRLAQFMCLTLFPPCSTVNTTTITSMSFASSFINSSSSILTSSSPLSTSLLSPLLSPFLLSSSSSFPLPRSTCSSLCTSYTLSCGPFVNVIMPLLQQKLATAIQSNALTQVMAVQRVIALLVPNCSATLPSTTISVATPSSSSSSSSSNSSFAFQCSATQALLYPRLQSDVTLSLKSDEAIIASTQCEAFAGRALSSFVIPISCPSPLVLADQYPQLTIPAGAYCALPCPLPYLTKAEWSTLDRFAWACSIASLITTSFLLMTWCVFPHKRAQRNVVYFIICCFMISVSIFVNYARSANDINSIACLNGVKGASMGDGGGTNSAMCVGVAMVSFYFASGMYVWWCLISFDLYLHITSFSVSSRQQFRQEVVFHVWGWGFPLLALIVGSANNAFGGREFFPLCLFSSAAPAWFEWAFFFFPWMVHFFVAVGLLASVIYALCKSSRQRQRLQQTRAAVIKAHHIHNTVVSNSVLHPTSHLSVDKESSSNNNNDINNKDTNDNTNHSTKEKETKDASTTTAVRMSSGLGANNSTGMTRPPHITLWTKIRRSRLYQLFEPHFRLVLFLVQFSFVFTSVMMVRVHLYFVTDYVSAAISSWTSCLMSGGSATPGSCGVEPVAQHFYKEEFYVVCFGITAQGFVNFLAYGTQRENFTLWFNCLRGRGTSLEKGGGGGAGGKGTGGKRSKNSSSSSERSSGNNRGGAGAGGGTTNTKEGRNSARGKRRHSGTGLTGAGRLTVAVAITPVDGRVSMPVSNGHSLPPSRDSHEIVHTVGAPAAILTRGRTESMLDPASPTAFDDEPININTVDNNDNKELGLSAASNGSNSSVVGSGGSSDRGRSWSHTSSLMMPVSMEALNINYPRMTGSMMAGIGAASRVSSSHSSGVSTPSSRADDSSSLLPRSHSLLLASSSSSSSLASSSSSAAAGGSGTSSTSSSQIRNETPNILVDSSTSSSPSESPLISSVSSSSSSHRSLVPVFGRSHHLQQHRQALPTIHSVRDQTNDRFDFNEAFSPPPPSSASEQASHHTTHPQQQEEEEHEQVDALHRVAASQTVAESAATAVDINSKSNNKDSSSPKQQRTATVLVELQRAATSSTNTNLNASSSMDRNIGSHAISMSSSDDVNTHPVKTKHCV